MLEASLAHIRRSRLEDGCISHEVAVDCENPLRLVFFERWRDRAALEAHFVQPGTAGFMNAVRAHAVGRPVLETYEATGS
jgi:quinol monooxygenase YgiN